MVWIHIDEKDFFNSSTIMVSAQEACAFANTQRNNENKNDKTIFNNTTW